MALLTPLPDAEARDLGAAFGLDVDRVQPIVAGSVNSNFRWVLTDGSAVFARIYEESRPEEVIEQNRLLAHLAREGVQTPLPRRRADGAGTVALYEDKAVCVFPFCDGTSICQRGVDEGRMEQIGAVLARIHRSGTTFEGAPTSRFGLGAIGGRLTALAERPLDDELSGDVARLRDLHRELTEHPPVVVDATVIHGDMFRDNVLWRGDGSLSAVLDFESASAGAAGFDIAVAALAWAFGDELEAHLVRALARGYAAERALGGELRRAVFEQARLAALRFAVTRITDYELRPRGVVAFKDYRRFLRRLDAVERWGPSGWDEHLRAS